MIRDLSECIDTNKNQIGCIIENNRDLTYIYALTWPWVRSCDHSWWLESNNQWNQIDKCSWKELQWQWRVWWLGHELFVSLWFHTNVPFSLQKVYTITVYKMIRTNTLSSIYSDIFITCSQW